VSGGFGLTDRGRFRMDERCKVVGEDRYINVDRGTRFRWGVRPSWAGGGSVMRLEDGPNRGMYVHVPRYGPSIERG